MGNQSQVLGLIDKPGVEGYLTYGGSVVGNQTNPPEVIEFFSLHDWEDGDIPRYGEEDHHHKNRTV